MKKHGLWLISEHGDDARDNGFAFFEYMRKKHPKEVCIYVASRRNHQDWEKVKKCGPVIQFGTILHKLCFILAGQIVTSHVGDSEPWDYSKIVDFRKNHPKLWGKKKIIFLQHGVIDKDVKSTYHKKLRPVDLFVCTTNQEAEYVKKTLGYNDSELALVGLPRYDRLIYSKPKKQILLIPTWRKEFNIRNFKNAGSLRSKFIHSEYFCVYNQLLNSDQLIKLLDKYDYELIFYPHYEMQGFIKYFKVNSPRIRVLDKSNGNVQKLIKESAVMITDYSSVAFDFAYMDKPLIYYQFDETNSKHYGKAYFDYERDGFGPVEHAESEMLETLESIVVNNCENSNLYRKRRNDTFIFKDQNHCIRLYKKIKGYL